MTEAAVGSRAQLVQPLFEFRNFGQQLPHHWSTIANGAAFGTDYFTRTAVAKSNIFVNAPNETKYFYQDLDAEGGGSTAPTLHRDLRRRKQPAGQRLLVADALQRAPLLRAELNRYSLGTKNRR